MMNAHFGAASSVCRRECHYSVSRFHNLFISFSYSLHHLAASLFACQGRTDNATGYGQVRRGNRRFSIYTLSPACNNEFGL